MSSSARDVASGAPTEEEETSGISVPEALQGTRREQIEVSGAETQLETSLVDWSWERTTAPLGGSIVFVATVQHETADVNIGTEMQLIGYFSDLQDPETDNVVQRTVTLDEDGTFDFTINIPVPNDPAFLGDQWVYAGIDVPQLFRLRGHSVQITEGAGGGNGGTNGDGDGDQLLPGVDQGTVVPVALGLATGSAVAWLRSRR